MYDVSYCMQGIASTRSQTSGTDATAFGVLSTASSRASTDVGAVTDTSGRTATRKILSQACKIDVMEINGNGLVSGCVWMMMATLVVVYSVR